MLIKFQSGKMSYLRALYKTKSIGISSFVLRSMSIRCRLPTLSEIILLGIASNALQLSNSYHLLSIFHVQYDLITRFL